jgi:transitional endoplasmic reticulum ATPase
VVAATNVDLAGLVAGGKFRQDLYYRLNEFAIRIPPLRERPDDIPYLARRFIDLTCAELGKAVPPLTPAAAGKLLAYPWPGNVRELRNVIRRAVLLADRAIDADSLDISAPTTGRQALLETVPETDLLGSLKERVRERVMQAEREILLRVLGQTGGNKAKAARLLHIDYKTIRAKARQYGIPITRKGGREHVERTADRPAREAPRPLSYEDIGGLKRELARIREIIELPLRYPEVFERLGIDAPKGVLLYGPPGCGKTLIARAVAHETEARFFSVNGPEIIHKFVGESEQHLRKIFEEATRQAPSIIFLDELDAIAPRRENVLGEVEKRVVAQLLALMDGLNQRQHVIVIAATNLPNNLDPALRRPGRFDREIAISIPDRDGRREILAIHSREMPLAGDVRLDQLASRTHGFVGADLEALCREAAMVRLRHVLPEIDFASAQIPAESLLKLEVEMPDFLEALREVEPSAIREVFVEVPEVRWEDVGGLRAVKQQLIEAVEWPLKHPGLFAQANVRPPRGILLSGPPGCGKTLLAKAVATQTEVNFISVKGPALLSKYVGESEKGVREVFRKARQAAPCILFFNELDALVPERGSGGADSHVTERVIGQFLAEVDGVEDMNGVLVLGATNRRDILDPALLRPGRFDLVVEIPLPDADGRREIFAIGLRGRPVADDVRLDELVTRSGDFTGADIQAVCQRAALEAIREAIAAAGGEARVLIRHRHLKDALERMHE